MAYYAANIEMAKDFFMELNRTHSMELNRTHALVNMYSKLAIR